MVSHLTIRWIVLFSCHSVNLRIVGRTFGFDNSFILEQNTYRDRGGVQLGKCKNNFQGGYDA